MRILVLEDDTLQMRVLTAALEKHNYEVVTGQSGKEAISILERGEQIDIIISDVMMPGVGGFGLLRTLKGSKKWRSIPVILCTALNDKQSVVTGIKLGAAGYVTKPINREVLIEKIESVKAKMPGAVLVVDDEATMRTLLSNLLQREGLRVIEARSGKEALEHIEKSKVAVILTDVQMPEMTGIELLAAVKKRYPGMPVLLMTGHRTEYKESKAVAAGADGYLAKPFRGGELFAKLNEFIGR